MRMMSQVVESCFSTGCVWLLCGALAAELLLALFVCATLLLAPVLSLLLVLLVVLLVL